MGQVAKFERSEQRARHFFEVRQLAADVHPAALHHSQAARLLLTTIASYTDAAGNTFAEPKTIARRMGYRLDEAGEATPAGLAAFWKTFAKLRARGLVREAPCGCPSRPHARHFQLDVAALQRCQITNWRARG